ncbi:MAG: phosphoglycerate kinase [Gemmataceae bacterium]|nr:phosphoglycerate kinase [Gemmataceae bacterium]MCS7270634.1 phosphoglycerate kinase [Gemmataceae bacterium]MDW8244173.1 phosphoglycerate kinase [Thermogemmata sp.]
MPKKTLEQLGEIRGKRILVRVDFNVPLDKKTGAVKNDRRIRAALPTIQTLRERGAVVILMSHLGRPEKASPEERRLLTMDRVAERLHQLLGQPVPVLSSGDDVVGPQVQQAVQALQPGQVVLLQNLRFDPREQKNSSDFAAALAALGDAYVNDAFGTCHNDNDTSMVALPAALKAAGKPRAIGRLVQRELEVLDQLLTQPVRPLVAIMGGAKVSDKLGFLHALLHKVDHLLIGGKMTYAFLKAQGRQVGATQVADVEVEAARPFLAQVGNKIALPVDYVAARSDDLHQTILCSGDVPDGYEGVDVGPRTVATYIQHIRMAGTVVWNGPVGWFEQPLFSRGTYALAAALAACRATTIVGGGETAEAVEQFELADLMTHVSTGGGAFLAYVEGKKFQSLAQIDDQ